MDMDNMNMAGMEGMSMMSPGPAPMMAPSPMSSHSMSAMSSQGSAMSSMVMSMQMYFTASSNVILWFKEWETDSRGKYAASIIGLLILCLLQEALVWFRLYIARSAAGARRTRLSDIETGSGVTQPQNSAIMAIARFGNPLALRLVLSFLYALNVFTSYMLMLAVMTFNVGYFIVIVLGLAFGHLMFIRVEQPSKEEAFDSCCPPPCCISRDPKLTAAV